MHARTLIVLFVLGVLAVFAAANWSTFVTPTTLSLLFATIQAPLGLVMLGFTALLTALFLLFIAYLQASLFLDTRRHMHELQAQRALADQAEASRIAELRSYLDAELPKLSKEITESRIAVETHLDRLDLDLRSVVEQAGNTLAAYIGELEDRLERGQDGQGLPSFRLTHVGIACPMAVSDPDSGRCSAPSDSDHGRREPHQLRSRSFPPGRTAGAAAVRPKRYDSPAFRRTGLTLGACRLISFTKVCALVEAVVDGKGDLHPQPLRHQGRFLRIEFR